MVRRSKASLRTAIVKANNVVWDNILERGATAEAKFEAATKRTIVFSGKDPITGAISSGAYFLNKKNVVESYNFYYWRDDLGGLLFEVDLNGAKDAFRSHTGSVSYLTEIGDPVFGAALINAYSGNGQDFANLLDGMPGADRLDPSSTYVSRGDGQSWFA